MSRLEQLRKLHEADPKDPFCTYGIALEHAKADDPDEAISWLNKTIELDGHYCYAYYQLAKAHAQLGDDVEARRALEAGMKAAAEAGDEHALGELRELGEAL